MDPQRFPTTSCPRTLVSCWYTDLGVKVDERGTAKRQNRTAECGLQILQTASLSTARCGCSIEPWCRTGDVLGLGNRRLLTTRFSHLRAAGGTLRKCFDTASADGWSAYRYAMQITRGSGRFKTRPSLPKASSSCSGFFGLQMPKSNDIAIVDTQDAGRMRSMRKA